jgi:hypothetical protein
VYFTYTYRLLFIALFDDLYFALAGHCHHCRQRAPVENVPSASGTSHLGMIDIQATTKDKYYDHIVLLYANIVGLSI